LNGCGPTITSFGEPPDPQFFAGLAKGAERVVALLLADDCVSPARAAKVARLSDRAARRLFDRLTDLGAVRELSGRPNFRLYGL
jgi:uncharacterized protein DUF1403